MNAADLSPELEVLRDVVSRLESARFDYMLTGSLAMSFYATPRMTRDIDFVVHLDGDRIDALIRAFEPDYYLPTELGEVIGRQGMFNLLHLRSMVKVDFVIRKSDAFRLHEFSRRRRVGFVGFEAWIVSPEDLILSKLLWAQPSGSESQMRDVQNLLHGEVDVAYLREWATVLGVSTQLAGSIP